MSEPTQPDVFDLDTFEQEGAATSRPPYPFTLGGKTYTLIDPQRIDYRELRDAFNAANTADFEAALSILLPADQRDDFFEHAISLAALEELFDRYTKHFGLAPGKSKRSSRR